MPPFLGFGFSGYRSVGDELVLIAPLKKINLIIGQNNSGKSNIINFLKYVLPDAIGKIYQQHNHKNYDFSVTDKHMSIEWIGHRIAFPIPLDREYFEKNCYYHGIEIEKDYALWLKFMMSGQLVRCDTHAFVIYEAVSLDSNYVCTYDDSMFAKAIIEEKDRDRLVCMLNGFTKKCVPKISPVEIIPAIRKIGEAETEFEDFSGLGIIKNLAELQHPVFSKQEDQQKFNSINEFVRTVLENESATLDIPHDKSDILVRMDGKTLPLSSLGTGIHEVIILASAATLLENSILCVEEPELHLHPLLQRKLIQYLASDKTSNQYIFTTHSAHLLDTEDAEIFHVRNINGKTTVEAISSTKDKSRICHDLGYKASDILQANCLIWVEGPSDRIYLNHWLKSVDETLVEGIHYSIMFFGGRLFSHITANDNEDVEQELNDFISVRKLNRHSCIFFDSDKDSPTKRINNTKQRLKKEFDEGEGFAWVTAGRETENYVNPDHIEECVIAVHPSASGIIAKDKWANTLIYKSKSKKKTKTQNADKPPTAKKVDVARHYVENYDADLSVYDLKQQIEKLRTFIYKANNLKIPPEK